MNLFSKFVSFTFCGLSALTLLSGCGNGSNGVLTPLTDAGSGNEQTLNFGSLTTRLAGTAQPPVVATGSGTTVTGVAGATVSSLVLMQQAELILAQSKIVFNSNRDGNPEIYTMNGDGSGQKRLTFNLLGDSLPTWSGDGRKIVFTTNRHGSLNGEIYSINPDGSGETRLTNNSVNDFDPVISPDGSKIAFTSSTNATDPSYYDIYIMNVDGTNVTKFAASVDGASDTVCSWSPDGSRLAFTSRRDGNTEIYTANLNGSDIRRLTNNGAVDVSARYSPDGTKIVFVSARDGNAEIYSMNVDGSAQTRLTEQATSDETPSWSPDGTKILFTRSGDGLWTMNPDGSSQLAVNGSNPLDYDGYWLPATTKRMPLIGTGAKLGASAAGFLYGQNGNVITSVVTFDTAATDRANTRITSLTPANSGSSNYIFTITASPASATASNALTSLAYVNDIYGTNITVVGAGGIASADGAIVSFNSATGKVSSVLPYSATRSAAPTQSKQAEGQTLLRGKFLGVWTADGKNAAPNGATEVEVNVKTGTVRIVH